MSASLKTDPGRTLTLRRAFSNDIRRRMLALATDLKRFIVTDDSLGLKRTEIVTDVLTNADPGNIGTNEEKLAVFQAWFRKRVAEGFLEIDEGVDPETPWLSTYVKQAYKKGLDRGYNQVGKKKKIIEDQSVFYSTKTQVVQETLRTSEAVSKLKLLSQRAYTNLKGISDDMDAELTRILVEGLVGGWNISKISNEMILYIKGITPVRANRIANTEIMYAHSEGQLDMYERLGVKEVGLIVEWLTAGDNIVCQRCQVRAGQRYTIAEARGLLPLHPNCRCIWTPVLL